MNHQSGKQCDSGGRDGDSRLQIPAPTDFIEFTRDAAEQSVQALFEQQVRRHTERLAVKVGDRTLTYGELNQAANRVAHAILSKKPFRQPSGPDSNDLAFWETHMEPVAVFMGQGIDAVAAAFGLLKAGKIFLPLDPTDPYTRVTFILHHAPAHVILTNDENVGLAKQLS